MYHSKKQSQKLGFGLIEVLISSVIIATMLGAAIFIGNLGISRVIVAQNRLIATNLASAAIEDIIAIRNRSYLVSGGSFDGTTDLSKNLPSMAVDITNYYTLDTLAVNHKLVPDASSVGQIFSCPPNTNGLCDAIALDSTGPIDFKRKISISNVTNSTNTSLDPSIAVKKVTVTVEWSEASNARVVSKVQQSILLTDWQRP